MQKTGSILIALAFSSSVLAGYPSPPSPQNLTASIRTDGAKKTVERLYLSSRSKEWNSVIAKIQTGDSRWLTVAGELAAGTDAGTSTDLQIALATALPKNPGGVLQLADTQNFLSLPNLCGAPFIEPSRTFLSAYLKQARQALRQLNKPVMEAKRTACLMEIDKALLELSKSKK